MKTTVLVIAASCLMGCSTSLKLAVPQAFKEQATVEHVDGARGNKMSMANFTTSRIKRGAHVSYPGWGRAFILENLVLHQIGLDKSGTVENEKAKFHYELTDGKSTAEIYAHEKAVTKKTEFSLLNNNSFFGSFEKLEQYNYIFSAMIYGGTKPTSKVWELMMTNVYDRKAENDKNLFAFIKAGDNGLATNGSDSIFIKPISTKTTETEGGKVRSMPFKLLSGYELSTSGGVIAIVDLIDRNVWFYNELDAEEKFNVSAIATAILARRVHNEQW
jgi:hypothetical protein